MNYRINTKVVLFVLLLVLVAIGLFVYTLVSSPVEYVVEGVPEETQQQETVDRILTAKHQYKDGTHALAGTAELPTPCHRLIVEPFILGTSNDSNASSTMMVEQVEVRFSTLLEGESCPNELFEVPFYVSFDAPEAVDIRATWNGALMRLNLIPVGPDEVLNSEVYIKG